MPSEQRFSESEMPTLPETAGMADQNETHAHGSGAEKNSFSRPRKATTFDYFRESDDERIVRGSLSPIPSQTHIRIDRRIFSLNRVHRCSQFFSFLSAQGSDNHPASIPRASSPLRAPQLLKLWVRYDNAGNAE